MAEPAPRPNRALLVKLAVGAGLLLVAAVLVARGLDLKGLFTRGLEAIHDAGPFWFFTAMALAPAVGAPLSFFALTAGTVFGDNLGMGVVIALSLLAITVNMTLTYFLAGRALRPLVEKLVLRLGYRMPEVVADDATDLIILLRVTGLPFPVQNYLLGLAQVPFRKYLPVSCAAIWPTSTAFVLFGDALLHGKGKVALIAFSAILALAAGTHLLRKHYGKKRA
jgi:uncharacterized membrane protein YdjX (TVP38/TMEM64 family)